MSVETEQLKALTEFFVQPGAPPPVMSTDKANLEDFLPPPKTKTKVCTPKYLVKVCGCGRSVHHSSCMSLDCTVCAEKVSMRRGLFTHRRLWDAITKGGFYKGKYVKTVIYTVFTVPMEIRGRFYDKEEWQKVRIKAWTLLKREFGAKFGLEASHPVGDPVVENGKIIADTDGTIFHPHLNFLWMQNSGFSPYLKVETLRKEWANILGVPGEVDVWANYTSSSIRLWKWAKYVCRSFPGMHSWCGSLRWYGSYPKNEPKRKEYLCPVCGEPIITIGWIDAFSVESWRTKDWARGVDPPWEHDYNIHLFKRRLKKKHQEKYEGPTG